MRVLVLSSTFPSVSEPTRGTFVFERIRRVAQHCDLIVVAPVPWVPMNGWIRGARVDVPFLERRAGLTVYHPRFLSLPRYGKSLDAVLYALCLAPFVARIRWTFPFDVVDAHFEYPDGVGATILARLFQRPVMVTLRGKIVRLSTYHLHRLQLRWMLRHADRVLAVSSFLRDCAAGLGRPPHRVRVIRNGVDSALFAPMPQGTARRLCGLPESRRILLTVAALYEHKGQHMVIEALPGLTRRYPDLLYVMVGAGRPGEGYVQQLEQLAARLGVAEHVRFVSPQLHSELRPWFCASDLSVLLTRSEGWPNVVLESLACGVPVVATNVGGVPEILRDGVDGILVPYGDAPLFRDAIVRAFDSPWNRDELVRYAQSLGWTAVVDEVLDQLANVAPRACPPSTLASPGDR